MEISSSIPEPEVLELQQELLKQGFMLLEEQTFGVQRNLQAHNKLVFSIMELMSIHTFVEEDLLHMFI